MAYFDSHTHLEHQAFELDRDQVIARAASAGVTRLVTCGSDLPSSKLEVQLLAHYRAQGYTGIHAAVGVHGHKASSAVAGIASAEGDPPVLAKDLLTELAALAQMEGVVALGELGLDYHYDFSPRPVQREVLRRQLALATELDLPVILHNRESDQDLRQVFDAVPGPLRGVLHCFLSDETMADWALERGLYLGVAGPLTFRSTARRTPELFDLLRRAPLDRLLIETDCPYLSPEPVRNIRRNEPAHVVHVAARLAELRGISPDELAERTTENACRLFGIA